MKTSQLLNNMCKSPGKQVLFTQLRVMRIFCKRSRSLSYIFCSRHPTSAPKPFGNDEICQAVDSTLVTVAAPSEIS